MWLNLTDSKTFALKHFPVRQILIYPFCLGVFVLRSSLINGEVAKSGELTHKFSQEAIWCLSSGPCLSLEVADTAQKKMIGLMNRPSLSKGYGMWFPFTPSREVRFWMYNTLAPLDIVFVYKGFVVAIEAYLPICVELPCPSYGPKMLVDGVVELAAGEANRLKIQVGDSALIKYIPKQI